MDTIQLLVSRFLDGELADDEIEQLAGRLRTDPDAVDRFVLAGFVHSQLNDWMDHRRVQDNAICGAIGAADAPRTRSTLFDLGVRIEGVCCDYSDLSELEVAGWGRPFWPRSMVTRAATVIVAVGLALAAYTFASRPVIVAQLTQANGCQWDVAQTKTSVGELLESDQELKLVKGQALVTFINGTQMLLEGPVSLRLNSASEVALQYGFIAAKVPRQAKGFAVSTSLARFVDLGTEFTIKLDAEKSFDLYVFDGMVELQFDERFGNVANKPLEIAEVRAIHFDVGATDFVTLPFNQGETMPF
jgi:hypothetical protein